MILRDTYYKWIDGSINHTAMTYVYAYINGLHHYIYFHRDSNKYILKSSNLTPDNNVYAGAMVSSWDIGKAPDNIKHDMIFVIFGETDRESE